MMKRTKIVLAVSAVTVLVGAASGAVAHRAGGGERYDRGAAMFEKLDANKDGKVTRAEAAAYRDQQIALHDENKDGALSEAEYTALVHAMMADHIKRRFARQDTDNSGTLDKDELSDRVSRMFDHLDKNNDGAVERTEMEGMGKRGYHKGGRG